MNKTLRKRSRVSDVFVVEGDLYAPGHDEDGTLVVCDFGVGCEVGGKRYHLRGFSKCGWTTSEDGFRVVDRSARREAEAFAAKVRRVGTVDLTHWDEVKELTWAEREALNLRLEEDERSGL